MKPEDQAACESAWQATCKQNGDHDWVTYMLGWQAAIAHCDAQPAVAQGVLLLDSLLHEFPLLEDENLCEVEHHCEWNVQQERKRLHALLKQSPNFTVNRRMQNALQEIANTVNYAQWYQETAEKALEDANHTEVALDKVAAVAVNEQLLKDAHRYSWLRDSKNDPALVIDKRTKWVPEDDSVPGVGGYWEYEYRSGEDLDSAVDTAIAAAEAAKGGAA